MTVTNPDAESDDMTDMNSAVNSPGGDARPPITVLVADDQALVRTGFAMVIDSQPDMCVVGLAADGREAVDMAAGLHPDVVLMDIRMPVMDGIEATRRIVEATRKQGGDGADDANTPLTRVLILTTFDLDEYVTSAILAGASGFLLKDAEPETLLADIRTVTSGAALIEPEATRRLLAQTATRAADPTNGANGAEPQSSTSPANAAPNVVGTYRDPEVDDLTEREMDILVEVAHGLSNQEIAAKLYLSVNTVKTHVAHILAKTNSRDRIQIAVFAYQNHLV